MKLPITSHFFLTHILSVLCCVALCCVTPACSSDEPDSGGDNEGGKPGIGSNRAVTLKDDGTTSDGGTYSWHYYSFVIDGIEYLKDGDRLAISGLADGYQPTEIKPYATVIYNKTKYTTTAIRSRAFEDCASLESFIFPSTVVHIGRYAFSKCTNLKSLNIPDTKKEFTIDEYAFNYCNNLNDIHLPKGLRTVNTALFRGCYSLKNIIIPATVTTIEYDAFYEIDVDEIDLSKSNISVIKSGAFRSSTIKNIKLPKSLKSIEGAFSNADHIDNVDLSQCKLSVISLSAFKNARIGNLKLPAEIKTVESNAFEDATIKNLTFGDQLKAVGQSAFRNSHFESLDLPSHIDFMGEKAFADCSGLKNIELMGKLKSVPYGAFDSSPTLTSVKIGPEVETIDKYAFFMCRALTSLEIGPSVKTIEPYAFGGTSISGTIVLPETLTEIRAFAFSGTDISSIIFPKGLKYLYFRNFDGCENLKTVVFKGPAPIIEAYDDHAPDNISISTGFHRPVLGIPTSATVYVPDDCIEEYRSMEAFSYIANLLPLSQYQGQ